MYKILGSDQKEYGPISADVLRQWLAAGRVNAQTPVQVEGSPGWKPLASLAEFSDVLQPPAVPAPAGPVPGGGPAPTSGLAIGSLVCGALGCFGITALAGLLLGVLALVKINKSQGRLGGQGLAIAGLCVSGVMLIFGLPMLAGLMLPAVARAKAKAQTVNCVNHAKQIGLAFHMYASQNNDTFPPAASWCDAIQRYLGSPQVWVCPADHSDTRCSYIFNRKLGGLKPAQVNPQTVLLFEGNDGWNATGGPEAHSSHHHYTYVVVMVDGSVRQVHESGLQELRWDP